MNTSTTLTDRYLYAATRSVPEKSRDDLRLELAASIVDAIDARVENGETADAAERAVLTDLGDPDKLAAGYTDRPLSLIGPKYYLEWWRLLKVLYAIIPACVVFAVALGMTIAGEGFGAIMGAIWPVLIAVIVHIGFWTTLVFAIIERSGATTGSTWTPDSLPEPRERGVGLGEMVTGLVMLVLIAGAVVWDRVIGFIPDEPGLSFFADSLWPWWIALLFGLMALEAALIVTVYRVRRWTIPLAVVNAVLALAVAVPALALLAQGGLLNAGYWPAVLPDARSADQVSVIVAIVTGFVIGGSALWDIIDVFVKAGRAERARPRL